MSQAQVLVVEDDEPLRQLFSTVLDLMGLEHRLCGSAEEALASLERQPADVVVTDLLLPGLDGRGFLRQLQARPELLQGGRVLVLSGSAEGAVRNEMAQYGVWRVLSKPITVKEFGAQVREALLAPAASLSPLTADESAATGADSRAPQPVPPGPPPLSPMERRLVEDQFAGMESLYVAYRDGALVQFARDLQQGDQALIDSDRQALRRVAHNLKSVMRTLGHDTTAVLALSLEDAADRGDSAEDLQALWSALSGHLLQLRRQHGL